MAWIPSHQTLRDHPKTRKAARTLDISIPTMIGHLQLLWWWALDYAENGDLSGYDNSEIADAAMWEGDPNEFVEALGTCGRPGAPGFLAVCTDPEQCTVTVQIHDWDDYAGVLISEREKNAARQKAYRNRHKPASVPAKAAKPLRNGNVTPADDGTEEPSALRNGNVTVMSPLRNTAIQHNSIEHNKRESLNPDKEIKQTSAAGAATTLAGLDFGDDDEEDDALPELFLTGPAPKPTAKSQNGAKHPPASAPVVAARVNVQAEPEQVPPEKPFEYPADFEDCWTSYPRRNGTTRGSKQNAFKVWSKLKAVEKRLAAAGARKFARSWEARRDGGRYIPDAEKWLRGKGWEVVEGADDAGGTDTPPEWASWEKDATGEWIPLRGDAETGRLPYGATDPLEVNRAHKQRWIEFNNSRRTQNGHRGGMRA